jgi:hypothetical protein
MLRTFNLDKDKKAVSDDVKNPMQRIRIKITARVITVLII